MHRKLAAGDLYFFFNESTTPLTFDATLDGKGKMQVWDAFTGQIQSLKGTPAGTGKKMVPLKLEGWETKSIFIKN